MKSILHLFILSFLFSCSPSPENIKYSLELAGDNRPELQQVLDHYKGKDNMKYRAACYLIAHLPYHSTPQIWLADTSVYTFFRQTDTLFQGRTIGEVKRFGPENHEEIRRNLAARFAQLSLPIQQESKEDIQAITADFLIDHIENAFDVWQTNPLVQPMKFDEFKEFILPYKTSEEYISLKRSDLRNIYEEELSAGGFSNIRLPIERFKLYNGKCRWIYEFTETPHTLGVHDLMLPSFRDDCHNIIRWTCNVFRSVGIPVVMEFTPQWINRERRHFWCVSPDSSGVLMPYTAPYNNLGEDWELDIRFAGKVYRKTYAAQANTPYFLAGPDEFLPGMFSSPLLSDQTDRYHKKTVALTLPFEAEISNRMAYLCFFGREKLNPVGWGVIDSVKKEVVFEKVPTGIVFFAVYYKENEAVPLGNPFVLDEQGNFREISCDYEKSRDIVLYRKFPEKTRLRIHKENMQGMVVVAGNDPVKLCDTLFIMHEIPKPYVQELVLANTKEYRYYGLRPAAGKQLNIAELEFLSGSFYPGANRELIPLPVFSKEEDDFYEEKKWYQVIPTALAPENYRNVCDGNMETFVECDSIYVDFHSPVAIQALRFAPRNANNMIVPGDHYTLYYYDGGWIKTETRQAVYNYICFENVPGETIYWLKNEDDGNEELPFFIRDGKQCFINIDEVTEI